MEGKEAGRERGVKKGGGRRRGREAEGKSQRWRERGRWGRQRSIMRILSLMHDSYQSIAEIKLQRDKD